MPVGLRLRLLLFAVAILFGAAAAAQEDDTGDAASDDAVEEIVVIAPKPGDRRRVDDDVLEDPLRARILKELYEMRADQEELEWRQAQAIENPSRIRIGYDPRDEYEIRNEMDILALPSERTKPATLFRIQF